MNVSHAVDRGEEGRESDPLLLVTLRAFGGERLHTSVEGLQWRSKHISPLKHFHSSNLSFPGQVSQGTVAVTGEGDLNQTSVAGALQLGELRDESRG